MLVLLFAVAVVALTLLALLFIGVVVAIVTGVTLLNALALILGLRAHRPHEDEPVAERWRPSSFRKPPEPPGESEEEQTPALKVHRL